MRRFLADEQGATALEYALFVGLIAIGMYLGSETIGAALSWYLERVLPR